MPPAFNLSQDQTLQLNPDLLLYCVFTQSKRGLLLREHLIARCFTASRPTLAGKPGRGASSSSAHTYRLRIFKERWLRGEDLNL
jgi:hypothetical protein